MNKKRFSIISIILIIILVCSVTALSLFQGKTIIYPLTTYGNTTITNGGGSSGGNQTLLIADECNTICDTFYEVEYNE